ncbi:MAG TPA: universal stress protein [Gemmatimonadales bacterium]
MYSTLVVPLDGSPVAEQALPVAASIARRHGASLHLVYAHTTLVQPLQVQGAPVYDRRFDEDRKRELDGYLARTAARLGGDDLRVSHAVVEGSSAAAGIAEEAGRRGAELIVITTHGRGGFSRVWMGSVATELLRSSPVPVLVARDAEDAAQAPSFPEGGPSHLLVPLDGSDVSAAALDAALEMGRPSGARYTVLRVVRTADTLLPYDQTFWTPAEQEFLDGQQELAREYVTGMVERLRGEGLEAEGVVTLEPDAARAIIRTAEERGADLVAMSTHARAGVARIFLGSVTDKVIRGAGCPVLVVRPGE